MTATLLALAALLVLCAAIAALLAVTGRRLVHTDHDLPTPARGARGNAPRRAR